MPPLAAWIDASHFLIQNTGFNSNYSNADSYNQFQSTSSPHTHRFSLYWFDFSGEERQQTLQDGRDAAAGSWGPSPGRASCGSITWGPPAFVFLGLGTHKKPARYLSALCKRSDICSFPCATPFSSRSHPALLGPISNTNPIQASL